MPIDSLLKRASVVSVTLPFARLEQTPAGAIAAVGRQFAAFCYVGIAAGIPAPFRPQWARTTVYIGIKPETA